MTGVSADKPRKASIESPCMEAKAWAIVVGVLAVVMMGAGWVWAEAEPVEVAVRKALSRMNDYGYGESGPSIEIALKAYKVSEIQSTLEGIYAAAKDAPTKARVLGGLQAFYTDPECDQERLRALARKAFFDEDQRVADSAAHLARCVLDKSEWLPLFRQRQETADDFVFLCTILEEDARDPAFAADFLKRELQRPVPDVADSVAREKWRNRMLAVLQRCRFPQASAPSGMRENLIDLIVVDPSSVRFIVPHLPTPGDSNSLARLRDLRKKALTRDVDLALEAAIACLEPSSKERENLESRLFFAIAFQKTGKDWQRVLRLNELVCMLALCTQSEAPLVKVCEMSKQLPIARRTELLHAMALNTRQIFYLAAFAFDTLSQDELKQMLDVSPPMCDDVRWLVFMCNTPQKLDRWLS